MSAESSELIKHHNSLPGPAWAIFNTLLIFILSQFVAAIIIESYAALFVGHPIDQPVLTYSSIAQFFFILIAEGLTILAVIWLIKRRGLNLNIIGWGRRLTTSDFTLAIGGFLVFFVSLVVINMLLTALVPSYDLEQAQDVGFKTAQVSTDKIMAFIALVILPPLGEEFLMRGYLFSSLRRVWSFITAGVTTSILFGAAHLLTGESSLLYAAAVSTFVLSMILVYLREKTGALYAGMMVHGLNNVLAFLIYFSS